MLTEVDKARLIAARDDLRANPWPFNMSSWGTCVASRISKAETGNHFHAEFVSSLQPRLSPLFGVSQWPEDLMRRYVKAQTSSFLGGLTSTESGEKSAHIAAEAIDRFLEADGDPGKFATSVPPLIPAFIPAPRTPLAVKVGTTVAGIVGTTLGLLAAVFLM